MISLLIEGAASALFPCTLVFLLPALFSAFCSRWRIAQALAGYLGGFTVVSWLLLTGRIDYWPAWQLALLVGFGAILAVRYKGEPDARSFLTPLLLGIAAAHLWEPCVGEAFGTFLKEAPSSGPSRLVRYSAYVLGLAAPLGFVAIAAWLLPNKTKHASEKYLQLVGIALLVVFAIALATGTHTSVISQLSAWSSWN